MIIIIIIIITIIFFIVVNTTLWSSSSTSSSSSSSSCNISSLIVDSYNPPNHWFQILWGIQQKPIEVQLGTAASVLWVAWIQKKSDEPSRCWLSWSYSLVNLFLFFFKKMENSTLESSSSHNCRCLFGVLLCSLKYRTSRFVDFLAESKSCWASFNL